MNFYETYVAKYESEMWEAIGQTFFMVGLSLAAAILIGLPLGTLLYLTRKGQRYENRVLFAILDVVVNIVRSFPFLLLVVFMIPLTRMIVGTALGTVAASIPLSVVAIATYSRLAEQSLLEVPRGVVEAASSMGATLFQFIYKFLYVEARSGLVRGLTMSTISFISYSTVVGVVGGGGIGDFAIRYGYQRYETELMVFTIAIMIILVQLIQFGGNLLARKLDKR
ncbi:methionine ABC transporter permease [Paenibacillus sp. Marseille-Q4541]|uniref:methionine ABC transporter permease n=1 Tax=Paenibacillus sp. Marseille-Q4541 TaxID=2831522 RepID=UPI001BAC67E4|nr:methionine ABC transporter permease [Paenibacillus sp. Marseille-Q4541]